MNREVLDLLATVEAGEAAKNRLTAIRMTCQHNYGEVKYEPIVVPPRYYPGDKEMGLQMGVDARPGFHDPGSTTRQWTRTCSTCGNVQKTTRTIKQSKPGPVAGTTVEVEVPDFACC